MPRMSYYGHDPTSTTRAADRTDVAGSSGFDQHILTARTSTIANLTAISGI